MKPKRRTLDLRSADEVIAEIEHLRATGYRRTKRWNLSQICEHLTMTMVGEMEGLGFRVPWIIRRTVGIWLTNRVLRTRRMPSVPTLPRLVPQSASSSNNHEVIDACIAAVRKSEVFDGSLADYPFVDNLSHDQWRQFMWIQASHHLSFLIPDSSTQTTI